MIKYCFGDKCIDFDITLLTASKTLPNNVKISTKYKQIVRSIKEIGLVEPIVICILDNGKTLKILDGHLRVEALKELKIPVVPSLISQDEESYTYNKHVNRLSPIQEQRMLKKAVESGVSLNKLEAVLGITADTLQSKFNLLNGICDETATILAEKHVPYTVFNVLKKMKPIRQIEVANIMTALNNFTRKFALSLLHTSLPEHLINPKTASSEQQDVRKNIERLEREMASVQIETQKLEEHYAANNLKFSITKSHIESLLNNTKVLHWLIDNEPEYLNELKKISNINSLNSVNGSI